MSDSNDDSCERLGPLVEAYRDGLLSGDERKLVAEHLSRCEACSADPAAHDVLALDGGALFPDHRIDASAVARQGRWRVQPITRLHAWRRLAVAVAGIAAVLVVAATFPRPVAPRPAIYGVDRGHDARRTPSPDAATQRPANLGVEIISAGNVTLEATAPTSSATTRGADVPRER